MSVEWSADCLQLEDGKGLDAIADHAFVQLRSRVLEYLTDSWCSQDKARLILEVVALTRPAVCVEVGAFTGSCSLPMLAALQFVRHGRGYVVEAWSNEESIRGLPAEDVNRTWWSAVDMAAVRTKFDDMLDGWSLRDWCDVLPMASADAVVRLPAIDFVHLDGNFSDEGAWQDSERFLPKVEAGGHILLSNALVSVAGKSTKMRALWSLFDRCDVVCEIDDSNTLLFRKR